MQNKKNVKFREKFNVESLSDTTTQHLHSSRPGNKTATWPIRDQGNIDSAWKTLYKNIIGAAEEAVGKSKLRTTHSKGSKNPWFTEGVKEITTKKKIAYL